MTLPENATGLVAHAANDVRVEPVPVRVPNATEAVVEVVYGGICGSDLHYWRHGAAGLSILKEPMLRGHEIVGVVREGASDGSGPTPGRRSHWITWDGSGPAQPYGRALCGSRSSSAIPMRSRWTGWTRPVNRSTYAM